jgi:tight adherence protein B
MAGLLLAGLLVGLGAAMLLVAMQPRVPRQRRHRQVHLEVPVGRLVAAVALGTIVFLLTGWLVAGILGLLLPLGLPALSNKTAEKGVVERLEALAAWTAGLRDLLAAGRGLNAALIASAASCPPIIREEVEELARELRPPSVTPTGEALRHLAGRFNDPAADLVCAALIAAAEERGQRLAEVLTALASSIRAEISMRRHVDAARSQARTTMRIVIGFSAAFFAGLALFARSFMSVYSSFQGEVVMALAAGLYIFGLFLMLRMSRAATPERILEVGA